MEASIRNSYAYDDGYTVGYARAQAAIGRVYGPLLKEIKLLVAARYPGWTAERYREIEQLIEQIEWAYPCPGPAT